jgi:hypothetical protein
MIDYINAPAINEFRELLLEKLNGWMRYQKIKFAKNKK